MSLFAFLEEDFFPVFVLGTNKVLLKSKNNEQTFDQKTSLESAYGVKKRQEDISFYFVCMQHNCALWSYLGALL